MFYLFLRLRNEIIFKNNIDVIRSKYKKLDKKIKPLKLFIYKNVPLTLCYAYFKVSLRLIFKFENEIGLLDIKDNRYYINNTLVDINEVILIPYTK